MIQIESISIKEFRGIKDLTLNMFKKNFAVCGPNGTGKSGIIDAIEFALTGTISRLAGEGTGNISVKEHAPHVDSRDNPAKASVELKFFIPSLNKSATILRNVKNLNKPEIHPNSAEVNAILTNISEHPEFVLTRRELMKYVLATPGKRSEEVQSLLRLDKIESIRGILNKIFNATEKQTSQLEKIRNMAGKELADALGIVTLSSSDILKSINKRRVILGLPKIERLEVDTSLKDGIATILPEKNATKIIKNQAIADLNEVKINITKISNDDFKQKCISIILFINELQSNKFGIKNITKENLFNIALSEFNNDQCPVCDTKWEPVKFKSLLLEKIETLKDAKLKRIQLETELKPVIELLESTQYSIEQLAKYGIKFSPPISCEFFFNYIKYLSSVITRIRDVTNFSEVIFALKEVQTYPQNVSELIIEFEKAILDLPDPSKQEEARDYLIICQERLDKYKQASRNLAKIKYQASTAKHIYELYASVVTEELGAIYKQVETSFAELYREIHHEDESAFLAKLEPSIGKLGFDVDFYGRGYFPPGAYHSEGHQDGMGLCLYLSLMKYIFGNNFSFAILDDVLMSVDAGHRRDVSRLFKKYFPNVQFVMTTHDDIWLRSMQTEGLIDGKNGFISFKAWDVDCGPTKWTDRDVWSDISKELQNNDVRSSAALLRNYLEYIAKELCHRLRASVGFRGDAQYTLGDLLPAATNRMSKLLAEGKKIAKSWSNSSTMDAIEKKEKEFIAAREKSNIENWQTNAAIHYNEWANFQKSDFEPVVAAYRELIEQFRCPKCSGLLYLSFDNRGKKQDLRCNCSQLCFNLVQKKN